MNIKSIPLEILLQQVQSLVQETALQQQLVACLPPVALGTVPAPAEGLCTAIAPSDQMLLHSLGEHRDAGAAVSQYFGVGLQQYYALAQALTPLHPETSPLRILDFACGFGRALRFLKFTAPGHTLHASEIQADALDFVRDSLGIETLLSAADPADFSPSGNYDFIWVVSLFSHLPDTLFIGWLKRLAGLLSDDGLLCFSVRGASQLAASKRLPADGILYERAREISPLDVDIYGTTYVSDAYVTDKIRNLGSDVRFARVQKALANEQDLYFVTRNPGINLDTLVAGWRHGVWGWVDVRTRNAIGHLHVEGWAGSKESDEPVTHIEISINGQAHTLIPNISRPDVAAFLGIDASQDFGWRLELDLPLSERSCRLEVCAATARQKRLLYYGYV